MANFLLSMRVGLAEMVLYRHGRNAEPINAGRNRRAAVSRFVISQHFAVSGGLSGGRPHQVFKG
jgi:hypothetical protein